MASDTYLGIMKRGEERLGLKLLTPEYEVTAMLFDVDRITPLDMLRQFSGSSTNLFKILKDLEAKGVASSETNPSDYRSKLYRLSDQALLILGAQWARYMGEGRHEIYAGDDPGDAIHRYTRTIKGGLKVNQFTCEYQILLYLNASPGMANLNFHDLVNVSQAKFNLSLAGLKRSGHIFFVRDALDGRRKLYHLSDRVKTALDEMGSQIFSWFDAKSELFAALQQTKS